MGTTTGSTKLRFHLLLLLPMHERHHYIQELLESTSFVSFWKTNVKSSSAINMWCGAKWMAREWMALKAAAQDWPLRGEMMPKHRFGRSDEMLLSNSHSLNILISRFSDGVVLQCERSAAEVVGELPWPQWVWNFSVCITENKQLKSASENIWYILTITWNGEMYFSSSVVHYIYNGATFISHR